MSKTFFVSLASVLSLWTWMPTIGSTNHSASGMGRPATAEDLPKILRDHAEMATHLEPAAAARLLSGQTEEPDCPLALTTAILSQPPLEVTEHHPQFAQRPVYLSAAMWGLLSQQAHWKNPDGTISHTHLEVCAPKFAKWPVTLTRLTVPAQIQLFHLAGRIVNVWGPLVRPEDIVWDRPEPMIGTAPSLEIRQLTVTYDMALANPDPNPASGDMSAVPKKGWFALDLNTRTAFDNGANTDPELFFPMYAAGAPGDVETVNHIRLGGHVNYVNSPTTTPQGHGNPNCEYGDTFVPHAPVNAIVRASAQCFAYQILSTFPGPGILRVFLNPNLHFGDAGQLLQEIIDPNPMHVIPTTVIFDPAQMRDGFNTYSLMWDQCTGAGNAEFTPGECASSLFVVRVRKGNTNSPTPPPPPPPPPGVCPGTWSDFFDVGTVRIFARTFTKAANAPANCTLPIGG